MASKENNTKNENNEGNSNIEEVEEVDLKKKDPAFFYAMKEYYDKTREEPSEKSKYIALELAKAHKRKKVRENGWLFQVKGLFFPITTLRVAYVAALVVISITSSYTYYYYFPSKSEIYVVEPNIEDYSRAVDSGESIKLKDVRNIYIDKFDFVEAEEFTLEMKKYLKIQQSFLVLVESKDEAHAVLRSTTQDQKILIKLLDRKGQVLWKYEIREDQDKNSALIISLLSKEIEKLGK